MYIISKCIINKYVYMYFDELRLYLVRKSPLLSGGSDFRSLGKPFLFLTIVPQEKILLAKRTLARLTDVKKLSKNTWKFFPTRLSVSLSTTPWPNVMLCRWPRALPMYTSNWWQKPETLSQRNHTFRPQRTGLDGIYCFAYNKHIFYFFCL